MRAVELKENVYWVGSIDWDMRNFHGYSTGRGSSYNAYLILDEKVTLVDTVKSQFCDEMIEKISSVIDPEMIEYIVVNHVEMDHSGAVPQLAKKIPNANILASPNGIKALKEHYDCDLNMSAITAGEKLKIGKRNLSFFPIPMVHWPDSMVCYLEEEKILFPNDAFGQHLASSERFDDELPLTLVMEEAKKYYANITLPYGTQVKKALEVVSGLEVDLLAPAHGVVWRSNISCILDEYKKWASNETEDKALIIYDTMWSSTEKIAYAIQRAFDEKNIYTKMLNLRKNHISDIMTDLLTAKYICVGSPTLNNNMLPTVASFLSYLQGLAPRNRTGLAFGSYGWGGQGARLVEDALKGCGFDMLEKIESKYVPTKSRLKEISEKLHQVL